MFDTSAEIAADLRSRLGETRFVEAYQVVSTGSTNADVASAARAGASEGVVLVADEQTAGRGRRDRTWASPPGASLSMSMLLRPTGEDRSWGWLSLLAGMAVTRGLRAYTGAGERVTLKWPNDVLIDGLKVCGILSERVETPKGPAAIVGIGINLALGRDDLPVPNATSLRLSGLPHERDGVAAAVLVVFDELYADWLRVGPPQDAYRAVCSSIGAPLTITVSEHEQIAGVGAGIDPDGRLVVNVAGELRPFAVGDVVHARLG